MTEPNPPPDEPYSKAFEAFVPGPDESDIAGLLAYAIYKASIRERVKSGNTVPSHFRNPTETEKAAYKGQAERALERYAGSVIEAATPDIMDRARNDAKNEIIEEVRERTGLKASISSGVVVWVVTVVLTIIAVFAAPDWVRALVEHATPPHTTTNEAPSATKPQSQ